MIAPWPACSPRNEPHCSCREEPRLCVPSGSLPVWCRRHVQRSRYRDERVRHGCDRGGKLRGSLQALRSSTTTGRRRLFIHLLTITPSTHVMASFLGGVADRRHCPVGNVAVQPGLSDCELRRRAMAEPTAAATFRIGWHRTVRTESDGRRRLTRRSHGVTQRRCENPLLKNRNTHDVSLAGDGDDR